MIGTFEDDETVSSQHSEDKGRRYTDRLGRSVFAVALAARDDNATECLSNSRPDISYVKQFKVECDKAGNKVSDSRLIDSLLVVRVFPFRDTDDHKVFMIKKRESF